MWTLMASLLLVCTSCAQTADYLMKREAQGCYRVEGHAQAYLEVNGILATGGATIDQCREVLWP